MIKQELVMTRIFDAPCALVWQAWAEPEHLMRWWGPEHFTSPVCKMDFRIGGTYLFCMQSPDGQKFWSTGTYKEIEPLKRIVCTDSFADEAGNIVSGAYYGMGDDFPLELLVTITFEDLGHQTRLTLCHAGMPGGDMGEMAGVGWNQSLDKLAASLL
jgi:uncharacterized protein YndB with AHSA1/START domain